LVPKVVTLNNLERRDDRYFALSPNMTVSEASNVEVVDVITYYLRQKCNPKNPVLSSIWLTMIFSGIT